MGSVTIQGKWLEVAQIRDVWVSTEVKPLGEWLFWAGLAHQFGTSGILGVSPKPSKSSMFRIV